MATTTTPMTFAEFEKIPETSRGLRYELRNGDAVEMPPPVHRHYQIQQRLLDLLKQAAGGCGQAGTEMGFKVGERNYRIADVAFLSSERWNAIPRDGYLEVSPELVIEVLSASNTAAEIRDKRRLCFENGCREFWVADPEAREIEVSTPDGHSLIYTSDQQVPLFFAPERSLTVGAVFS